MNNNHPLRLNVGYLYNKSIGTSRQIPIDFDQLQIEDLLIKNLRSVLTVSRTREGLLLQVEVEADVQTACTRCLDEFFLPVKAEFEELFEFPSRQREDTDLVLPMDGYIDLGPLFREYLILATPIKHLCKPDCKGLCVVCGANLNETTCEHHPRAETPAEIIEDGNKI